MGEIMTLAPLYVGSCILNNDRQSGGRRAKGRGWDSGWDEERGTDIKAILTLGSEPSPDVLNAALNEDDEHIKDAAENVCVTDDLGDGDTNLLRSTPDSSFGDVTHRDSVHSAEAAHPFGAADGTSDLSIAAYEASLGIHYVRDKYPTEGSVFLAALFASEPIEVDGDERVEVLNEVTDYAVRIKVLESGAVGLIPAWNVEGALEKLARINMTFNEAATCPEEKCPEGEHTVNAKAAEVKHIHSRCMPQTQRVKRDRRQIEANTGDGSASGSNASDEEELRTPGTSPTRKMVVVSEEGPQTMYRYLAADVLTVMKVAKKREQEKQVGDRDGEDIDSGAEDAETKMEEDIDWWWDGWEEKREEAVKPVEDEPDESESDGYYRRRSGRPRVRRLRTFTSSWMDDED